MVLINAYIKKYVHLIYETNASKIKDVYRSTLLYVVVICVALHISDESRRIY